MCATKALLAGDGDVVSDIFRQRMAYRGAAGLGAGWGVAYGKGMRAGSGLEGKAVGKDE
jgi:formate dehydrogenase iron-sulfur subunit